MAAPGFGHGSYVSIGRESAWGTGVTVTRRFRVVSSDIQGVRGKIPSDAITDSIVRKSWFSGPQRAQGKIELEADYEGQLHLWDAVMGTGTFGSNGGSVSGAGPYTWAFINKSLANSYTIEEIAGSIPTGKANKVTGAKFKSLSLSGAGGQDAKPLRLSLEFVGKDYATNVSPSASPSPNSPLPIMFHHIDTANSDSGTGDAAGSERFRAFELTINNNLAEDRWYGADTIDEPLRDDYAQVQFKWTMEFATKTAIDEYIASSITNQGVFFKLASGTKSISFAANNGLIVTPVGRPVDRWGILTQQFTTEITDDGTTGLTVTIINSEASLT